MPSDQEIARAKTDALLRDLWRKKLPMVRDHLALLDKASQTLQNAILTGPLRAEAAIAAHKLAGSLGMFGFPEGTRIARDIERILDAEGEPPAQTFAGLVAQLRESLPH